MKDGYTQANEGIGIWKISSLCFGVFVAGYSSLSTSVRRNRCFMVVLQLTSCYYWQNTTACNQLLYCRVPGLNRLFANVVRIFLFWLLSIFNMGNVKLTYTSTLWMRKIKWWEFVHDKKNDTFIFESKLTVSLWQSTCKRARKLISACLTLA